MRLFLTNVIAVGLLFIAPGEAARSQQSFSELARSAGTPQVPGLTMVYLSPLGDPRSAPWKNIIVHQTEGPPGSAHWWRSDRRPIPRCVV